MAHSNMSPFVRRITSHLETLPGWKTMQQTMSTCLMTCGNEETATPASRTGLCSPQWHAATGIQAFVVNPAQSYSNLMVIWV